MSDNQGNEQKPNKSKIIISYSMGILMICIYLGIACLLGFTTFFDGSIFAKYKYPIAIIFLLYGLFRAYRLVRISKNSGSEDEV